MNDNTEKITELNIQPQASILNVFSRLNYKSWNAIAEFVDNSTQSYFNNEERLKQDPYFEQLVIRINYDSDNNTLTIQDNAYGMEFERFVDAIRLDSKHSEQTGRNEFGMGLKTAASWFGNVWSVTSTQYGSPNQYTATINIPELRERGLNSIQIRTSSIDSSTHGTTVHISQLTKKIHGKAFSKIQNLLASMYRRDLLSGAVKIYFNDDLIQFNPYQVLKFREKEWKKELDFTFEFDGVEHNVTGFVAIMNPGSFIYTGFSLFRHNRVIIGGDDQNYKPREIFGQQQSQISLKLYGELNLDDFPVNQAKDGFIWEDGLEYAFVDELKQNILEYIEIAALSTKKRAEEERFNQENSDEVQKNTQDAINNLNKDEDDSAEDDASNSPESESTEDTPDESNDLDAYKKTFIDNPENNETIIPVDPRSYDVQINKITKNKINVVWSSGTTDYWFNHVKDGNEIDVKINIDHPFFKPYTNDVEFQKIMEKFVVAFILAQLEAQRVSYREGLIPESEFYRYMNENLKKMSE